LLKMYRYLISLATLFVITGLFLVPNSYGEEPTRVQQIFECEILDFEEIDDFYKVNPTLRTRYYGFLKRSVFPLKGKLTNDKQVDIHKEFIYMGRFRLYVQDIFNNNHKLVHHAKQTAVEIVGPDQRRKDISFRQKFKEIEKISRRLSRKISLLLPGDMNQSKHKREAKKYFTSIAQKGLLALLVRLLLLKINELEHDICTFFFPDTFTVSIESLNTDNSPKYHLDVIEIIAKILSSEFPWRGLPSNFYYAPSKK